LQVLRFYFQNDGILFFVLFVAAIAAIVSCILFALQTDDRANSFRVHRGEAFWLQVSIVSFRKSPSQCEAPIRADASSWANVTTKKDKHARNTVATGDKSNNMSAWNRKK